MSFHADVEGFEAAAEDPGVEGGEGGAGTAAEEVDFMDQFFFADNNATKNSSLTIDPFCSGMKNDICSIFNWPLIHGRCKTIVNILPKIPSSI